MHDRNRDRDLDALAGVTARLAEAGIPHALIGAAALAVHGISRSTLDIDLFAVDGACLQAGLWAPLQQAGFAIDVRRGDGDDPLAGVVRIGGAEAARPVDLVIGRSRWQQDAISRARPGRFGSIGLPVMEPADLILLKLYAGGPQDAWDIEQLLMTDHRDELITVVAPRLTDLPAAAGNLWRRLLARG